VSSSDCVGDRERKSVPGIAPAQLLILVIQEEALVEAAQVQKLGSGAKEKCSRQP
jgi:hypothetical protein